MEAHGGKIWAGNNHSDSDVNGRGATFTFSLPLAMEGETTAGTAQVVDISLEGSDDNNHEY